MADAKKCDRCGTFYMRNNVAVYDEHGNLCYAARIKLIGSNGGLVRTIDLCDECHEKMSEFLLQGHKEDSDEVSEV